MHRTAGVVIVGILAVLWASACGGGPGPETAASVTSSDAFAAKYAELREQGKSHKAATELATLHVGGRVDGGNAAGSDAGGQRAMEAAVVLARYSSPDRYESARRGQAAEELKVRFQSRDLDDREAMALLDAIAPETSIDERREAARKLAELSQIEDWDDGNTLEAAEEINRLITGDHLHAERRIAAAKELARRSETGDLDAGKALDLMNDIAPGLSINARREAAGNLVRLSQAGRWDADTTRQAAEETFKVVTGGDLDVEKRTDAAVDLVGEGIKRFGGDDFQDRDVDVAGEMIKEVLKGDLTTDKVSELLDLK